MNAIPMNAIPTEPPVQPVSHFQATTVQPVSPFMSDNCPLSDMTIPSDGPGLDPLVSQYWLASRAPNTNRAYAADLEAFARWGGRIPSNPTEIANYLAHSAASLKPGTLHRRLAALAVAHRDRALPDPTKHFLVRRVMQGIDRRHAQPLRQVAPLTLQDLSRIVELMDHRLGHLRDRAVLLTGFFGALRRSEIAALDVGDIAFNERGANVHIRASKTDQLGRGRNVNLPKLPNDIDPCSAIQTYLARANASEGAAFRSGDGTKRISDRFVARIVKRWAEHLGYDPAAYSGHSLRAGFATSAAQAGYDASLIARQTGHRSLQVASRYVRLK